MRAIHIISSGLLCLAPTGAGAQFSVDPSVGIWINASEIAQLPMAGDAWNDILMAATQTCPVPDLFDQGDDAEECVLAKAIVSTRLLAAGGFDATAMAMRADVLLGIGQMMDESNWCENDFCEPCGSGGCTTRRTLALGRNLGAYLAAAELIGIGPGDVPSRADLIAFLDGTDDPLDPEEIRIGVLDYQWIDNGTAASPTTRRTLRQTHDERPNNWGGQACASLAAAAILRENASELLQVYQVALGWVGDCQNGDCSHFVFDPEASDWTCDQSAPSYGINEAACLVDVSQTGTPDLMDLSGVQVDDMRRGGPFPAGCDASPRACVADVHIWEGLQGRFTCAWILRRQGLDVFSAAQEALRRAYEFQHRWIWQIGSTTGWWHPPHLSEDGSPNDDAFLAYIANYVYGGNYPLDPNAGGPGYKDFGKGFGWTRYTLGENACLLLSKDPDFDGICPTVPTPAWWGAPASLGLLTLGARALRRRVRGADS